MEVDISGLEKMWRKALDTEAMSRALQARLMAVSASRNREDSLKVSMLRKVWEVMDEFVSLDRQTESQQDPNEVTQDDIGSYTARCTQCSLGFPVTSEHWSSNTMTQLINRITCPRLKLRSAKRCSSCNEGWKAPSLCSICQITLVLCENCSKN